MGLKSGISPFGGQTHIDISKIHQLRSADYLYDSLTARSKNQLRSYQKRLSVTTGKEDALFDDKVRDLILRYALKHESVQAEIKYLNQLQDDDGFKFSRDLKLYEKTSQTFERFSQPDYTSFRWNENYRKSLEQLKQHFAKFGKLKPLNYNSDRDMIDALPKKDTHSGWTYILSGLKKKGDNMEGIHKRYSREMERAFAEGTLSKPILVGFRTQASGEYEDNGKQTNKCKHKTRVVCMVDLIQILLELKYARPFQRLISASPMYAGGKDPTDISTIIHNARRRQKNWWSIDYSSFDMTISSWLIEDAFDIVRSSFIKVDDKEWDIIVHDFIHKDFVINEGVVHSDKGVPSGSMFTQIIDSIVNLLVVNTFFNSINQTCEMISMGDDNLIFHQLEEKDIGKLISYLNKNFGLITNSDKSTTGSKTQYPEFLSRFWRVDGQWRHPNLLLSRLLFPERYRDYKGEIGPEHVVHAFILTYKLGMGELIDVWKFMQDYPISRDFVWAKVDSKYLPGAMAHLREYTFI